MLKELDITPRIEQFHSAKRVGYHAQNLAVQFHSAVRVISQLSCPKSSRFTVLKELDITPRIEQFHSAKRVGYHAQNLAVSQDCES